MAYTLIADENFDKKTVLELVKEWRRTSRMTLLSAGFTDFPPNDDVGILYQSSTEGDIKNSILKLNMVFSNGKKIFSADGEDLSEIIKAGIVKRIAQITEAKGDPFLLTPIDMPQEIFDYLLFKCRVVYFQKDGENIASGVLVYKKIWTEQSAEIQELRINLNGRKEIIRERIGYLIKVINRLISFPIGKYEKYISLNLVPDSIRMLIIQADSGEDFVITIISNGLKYMGFEYKEPEFRKPVINTIEYDYLHNNVQNEYIGERPAALHYYPKSIGLGELFSIVTRNEEENKNVDASIIYGDIKTEDDENWKILKSYHYKKTLDLESFRDNKAISLYCQFYHASLRIFQKISGDDFKVILYKYNNENSKGTINIYLGTVIYHTKINVK